jgi:hypothetical protein
MIRRSQGMQTTTTVGLDIAKSVFQVHGIDADGNIIPDARIAQTNAGKSLL